MALVKIFAQLNCANMERSAAWFEGLFGRPADAYPMDGLAEWHHGDGAGFQLLRNDDDTGHGCMTLIVDDLAAEVARLGAAGIETGDIRSGDVAAISQLADPDGNVVVLAEPTI